MATATQIDHFQTFQTTMKASIDDITISPVTEMP